MRERTSNSGNTTYQVLFRHGSKQRSKSFATVKGAQKFEDLIRLLGIERALAELEGSKDHGPTLDECSVAYWKFLEGRVRSQRTIEDYKRDYKNWIAEPLGWMPATHIDETHVQTWIETMIGKLAAKSIGDRHTILHGIFKFACSPTRQLVPLGHNPCIGSDLPKKPKRQARGIQPTEWQALLRALDAINTDSADLAEFLVATGWRWSEATALSTFEVEDYGKDRTMYVTMSQVARRNADGSVDIVQDAKSSAGQRRIGLDADIAETIRTRMIGKPAGSLVFTTTEGSMWNYAHYRSRFWAKAVKAAGLTRNPTIHQLRHTAVGYLALSDAKLPEIQKRIGHESIKTTIDVYGSMIQDVNPTILDAFAAIRGKRVRPIAEVERLSVTVLPTTR